MYFFAVSMVFVFFLDSMPQCILLARRTEMLEIVEATLFYLVDRPVVHSEVSGLPFMVSFISFALVSYQSIIS